jgi:hypothetical protein
MRCRHRSSDLRRPASRVPAVHGGARWRPSERLALGGFLAGYRGLTREAYTLDLRQFTGWCRARSVPLFSVRLWAITLFIPRGF